MRCELCAYNPMPAPCKSADWLLGSCTARRCVGCIGETGEQALCVHHSPLTRPPRLPVSQCIPHPGFPQQPASKAPHPPPTPPAGVALRSEGRRKEGRANSRWLKGRRSGEWEGKTNIRGKEGRSKGNTHSTQYSSVAVSTPPYTESGGPTCAHLADSTLGTVDGKAQFSRSLR